MAAPKLCDKCGTYHHEHQGHVFSRPSRANPVLPTKLEKAQRAINTAQRANAAINRPAINKVVDGKTPNRRARAAYNAYMREYMARRRAARRVSGAAT